jgi:hypothetical protein
MIDQLNQAHECQCACAGYAATSLHAATLISMAASHVVTFHILPLVLSSTGAWCRRRYRMWSVCQRESCEEPGAKPSAAEAPSGRAFLAAAATGLLRGGGGTPLPKVVGGVPGRKVEDRFVGTLMVGLEEAEPAGSGRGCGGGRLLALRCGRERGWRSSSAGAVWGGLVWRHPDRSRSGACRSSPL